MNKKTKIWLVLAAAAFFLLNCRTLEVAGSWGATITPLPTRTPRPTFTAVPSPTSTAAPTERPTPTRRPTLKGEKVLPTFTPKPVPTNPPMTAPPAPSPHTFRVESVRCYHSGQSFVEGLVLENSDPHSGLNGVKVRISAQANGPPAADYETQEHFLSDARFRGSYNGYFWFGVNAGGAAPGETRYVWVVDALGKALSDPNTAKATFNNFGPDDPRGACWNIQIIFVRFQG